MSGEIVNRVASSSLITFNLEEYYHSGERVVYDIRQNLYQDLILKEKDFRTFVKEYDWQKAAKDTLIAIEDLVGDASRDD